MKQLAHASLAPYTSLRVGGSAEKLLLPDTSDELTEILNHSKTHPWLLGFGCNVLISDVGLPGTTVMLHRGTLSVEQTVLVADAGVWWDDAVKLAIDHGLWGLELTSEIPSSVGGAVYGNIAAYGQQVSDTLAWIDVYDTTAQQVKRLSRDDIMFAYRESSLQQTTNHIILRAAFQLSTQPLHQLRYDSALIVGEELGLDHTSLEHRRKIIVETRRRAGSLYDPSDPTPERTAGSFFKNPLVSIEQAKTLAQFDESGKTLERIMNQSTVHGGNAKRASAAHVLLAAGYSRGQTWGNVRLHPSHVLKVSTLPGATAQEVYDVTKEIVTTVQQKLGIALEPEVKMLGDFSS